MDVKRKEIEAVELKTNETIKLVKKDKEFALVTPSKKNFKKEEIKKYFGNFSNIKFKEFYKHDDKEIQGLSFNKKISVHLNNHLTYRLNLSQKKDKHFMKIHILTKNVPKEVVLGPDSDKEKVQSIDEIIRAQAQAKQFNLEKGAWVYKIDSSIFEKLAKKTKDFL